MPFEIQFGKIRVGYRVVYVSKYITLMLNLRELLLIARLEKFFSKIKGESKVPTNLIDSRYFIIVWSLLRTFVGSQAVSEARE